MHHYCLPTWAIVRNRIVMPFFHKTSSLHPCCCSKYAATLESTPQKVTQLASFFLFINFYKTASYNVLSQQLFRDTLNCPWFQCISGSTHVNFFDWFSNLKIAKPDFFRLKLSFETTFGSLKAGVHYIHYPYKSILPVQFRYQKTFIDTFFYCPIIGFFSNFTAGVINRPHSF
jgi:hypothetical protein